MVGGYEGDSRDCKGKRGPRDDQAKEAVGERRIPGRKVFVTRAANIQLKYLS
jgi:hypothetical protein